MPLTNKATPKYLSFILISVSSLGLTACTQTLEVPGFSNTSCGFTVDDNRADPGYLYAHGSTVNSFPIAPPLSDSLTGAVCSKVQSVEAEFKIDSFSCTATGFIDVSYKVELSGALIKPDGSSENLKSWDKKSSSSSFIVDNCAAAAKTTIFSLAESISSRLSK